MAEHKKKLALVSININAAGPMTSYIAENAPDFSVTNYLDEYLMEQVRAEGGVTDSAVSRMLQMIGTACADGAQGIIMTCTVFTGYQPAFSQLFSVPIVGADSAMLAEAAAQEGRTAIVYSFPGTYGATLRSYKAACRALGRPDRADMVLAEGAFDAARRGDTAESDRIVRGKLLELDGQYNSIVLAQMSLAGAARGLRLGHAQVFTSPACAVRQLRRELEAGQTA